MDARVSALIDEMNTIDQGQELNDKELRNKIIDLHDSAHHEEDKVSLIQLHKLLMDCVERNIVSQEGDLTQFQNIRYADYKMLLLNEASVDGIIDPDSLAHITRREIAEGRMSSDDDLFELARAGSAVLGKGNAKTPRKTSGFWSKLLRR